MKKLNATHKTLNFKKEIVSNLNRASDKDQARSLETHGSGKLCQTLATVVYHA